MQALDPPRNPTEDPRAADPSAMPGNSSPIHSQNDEKTHVESNARSNNDSNNGVVVKRERPYRACTQRASARLAAAAEAEAEMAEKERKRKRARKEKSTVRVLKEESEEEEDSFGTEDEREGDEDGDEENGRDGGGSPSLRKLQCGKIVTQLVGEVEPSQVPRWNIRSMWQLASILNFLNVFRPLLNIKVEFSAEEFETALLTPNNTLGDVHMPLLKAIPPVTRMALGHNTWVTVLCRKLRDWWHWVADGDLPIVASHGAEIEAYSALDPEVRVLILKALCDIRVEQEDIRNYIDDSMKHGVHLSAFRKERIGGDSHGISYWYEDDPLIGHRLYREIRKVEVKKGKGKSAPPIPHLSYQWETVATNFDEFLNVSDKLFSSKNRTEVSVGKKLKNNMLSEIEKVHKRKEKQLKKQHRQALMLDNMISMDSITAGRSLRDRKPVTYTFDDYDRSINDAIKVTKKKQLSPEPFERREPPLVKMDGSSNGRLGGGGDSPHQYPPHDSNFSAVSPNSFEDDDDYGDDEDGHYDDQENETLDLDRSNRRRQKPQRYSVNDFVDPLSDNDPDFESDEDIVGEVVYDEEYLRKRNNKRRKTSSSSESEEEYHFEEENPEEEDEEEEEEEDNDSSNTDEDSDNPHPRKFKAPQGRTRHGTKLRSVDELQSGLRRSKRSTRNRINYQQYEMSESETELPVLEKSDSLEEHYDASDNDDGDNELSMGSQDFEKNVDKEEVVVPENGPAVENIESNAVDDEKTAPQEEESNGGDKEGDDGGVREKRRFLDLNELAPGSGIDDGPALNRDDDDEF